MKKIILPIAVLILVVLWFYSHNPLGTKALINGHTIFLELAVTDEEKALGLGNRPTIPQNSGMLFVYQHKDRHGFWMKGMQFPLDFLWIDGHTIVDITTHVPAPNGGKPKEVAPAVPVDKVLEVNAGVVNQLGIRVGDSILFTD